MESNKSDTKIYESASEYHVQKNKYTLKDYQALPQERRTELIDGIFYDMSAPSLEHQIISAQLSYYFQDFIQQRKGDCFLFTAPVDVRLDNDDYTMLQPDLAIVCQKEKLTKQYIAGAPDFIIEIVSPSTRKRDQFLKLMKYQNAGVREFWIVDVEKERIITYFFEEDDIPVIYGLEDDIPVKIYQRELVIHFKEILQALKIADV